MLQIACVFQLKKEAWSNPTKRLGVKQFLSASTLLIMSIFPAYAMSELPIELYNVSTIATQLHSPWSMVQLPDDTWLITERDGHVVIVENQTQVRVKLALDGLYVAGQGGLLDIVVSPHYSSRKELFVSYAQGELDANRLVIAKVTFDGSSFSKPKVIYQVKTDKGTPQHYAGRLLVLPDNTLLVSSGDGFDYREQAQLKSSQLGKILRINLDGTVPSDNPFIQHSNSTAHAIYTLGHRNPQGLVFDHDQQRIVSHEHGPAGGDELNFLTAGKNYGWPVITFGKDYSQARISPFTEYPGMTQPIVDWTPSIAPSGMAYYGSRHKAMPSLQRHVLVSTLVDKKVYAVNLSSGQFEQFAIFPEISARIRDVYVTNKGEVAILTDRDDAKLFLITAK